MTSNLFLRRASNKRRKKFCPRRKANQYGGIMSWTWILFRKDTLSRAHPLPPTPTLINPQSSSHLSPPPGLAFFASTSEADTPKQWIIDWEIWNVAKLGTLERLPRDTSGCERIDWQSADLGESKDLITGELKQPCFRSGFNGPPIHHLLSDDSRSTSSPFLVTERRVSPEPLRDFLRVVVLH